MFYKVHCRIFIVSLLDVVVMSFFVDSSLQDVSDCQLYENWDDKSVQYDFLLYTL